MLYALLCLGAGEAFFFKGDCMKYMRYALLIITLMLSPGTFCFTWPSLPSWIATIFNAPSVMQATVRRGSGISQGEIAAVTQREMLTRQALIQLTGTSTPVRIGLAASGGGIRAMIATIGFLLGLQDIGVLQTSTYLAGVSGGCWAIAPWITSGISLAAYRDQLAHRMQGGLVHAAIFDSISDFEQFVAPLMTKYEYGQPLSAIDVYGSLLAHKLLPHLGVSDINQINLTSHINRLDGSVPYPLYTAVVDAEVGNPNNPYIWLEYTPHEIAAPAMGTAVPARAFGKKFTQGVSYDKAPEYTLGFCLGTWGSAFTANMKELLAEVLFMMGNKASGLCDQHRNFLSAQLVPLLQGILAQSAALEDARFSPAQVHNFMAGMPGAWEKLTDLTIIDAGLDCNLPVPPLLRKERAVDMIILLDASSDAGTLAEPASAAHYAQVHGIPFPPVTQTPITAPVTVFAPQNDQEPVVVYISLPADFIQNNPYAGLTNFDYTPEQVLHLSETARSLVVSGANRLKAVIKNIQSEKENNAAPHL